MSNKLKGWKTVLFNILMLIAFLGNQWGFETGLDEESINVFISNLDAVIGFVTVVGNILLRHVTDSPVGYRGKTAKTLDN